uniref:Galactose mutarotase n=1 Tax=Globodera rostochiensis TaxID=31243 RepID=A0A914H5J3_GLORO
MEVANVSPFENPWGSGMCQLSRIPGGQECVNFRESLEDIEATSDLPCPVNVVQHNYFNLAGHGDIRDHSLKLKADRFTPTSPDQIPTGEILTVSGTELDFREEKKLQNIGGQPIELDHNFVLNNGTETDGEPAAVLKAPDNSLTLTLRTNQPGLQVYTSKSLSLPVLGLRGQHYAKFGAICLEDQNFPDAVNHRNFPNSILRPGETYKHWAEIEIS